MIIRSMPHAYTFSYAIGVSRKDIKVTSPLTKCSLSQRPSQTDSHSKLGEPTATEFEDMSALRRNLYKRLAAVAPLSRPLPSSLEYDDFDDSASIRTVLPSYSQIADTPSRPCSPPPSYYSLHDAVTRPVHTPPMRNNPTLNRRSAEHQIVDELVHRLRDIIKNPATWRAHENGQRSFFWALRCVPGTADVLYENTQEIKDRILGSSDFQVERFSFIFKGQRLVDLWCRPIQNDVYPLLNFALIFRDMVRMSIL